MYIFRGLIWLATPLSGTHMLPFIQFTDFPPPPSPPPLPVSYKHTYTIYCTYTLYACQYELHEYSVHAYYHRNMFTYGHTWKKSLRSFPPCYSQSPQLTDFTPTPPPPPLEQKWFETGLWRKHIYGKTSSQRTLMIMPRNLNEIIRLWIRLLGSNQLPQVQPQLVS